MIHDVHQSDQLLRRGEGPKTDLQRSRVQGRLRGEALNFRALSPICSLLLDRIPRMVKETRPGLLKLKSWKSFCTSCGLGGCITSSDLSRYRNSDSKLSCPDPGLLH